MSARRRDSIEFERGSDRVTEECEQLNDQKERPQVGTRKQFASSQFEVEKLRREMELSRNINPGLTRTRETVHGTVEFEKRSLGGTSFVAKSTRSESGREKHGQKLDNVGT